VLFLSLIFCKQEEQLLFFRSVSGCTCLILSISNNPFDTPHIWEIKIIDFVLMKLKNKYTTQPTAEQLQNPIEHYR
jgi:hypothetical protein